MYPFPEDGRQPDLSYALVASAPVPEGTFDQCWVRSSPRLKQVDALVRVVILDGPPSASTSRVEQLNPTLGRQSSGADDFATRPTRFGPLIAALFAAAVGALSVWLRRLEMACAMHLGVGRAQLTAQVILETLAWVLAGILLLMPALSWVAVRSVDPESMLAGAVAIVFAALLGAVSGAIGLVASTHESLMFRYQRG